MINLDEATNLVKNCEFLPFKLKKEQFTAIESDLTKYEDLKAGVGKLYAKEELPEIREYDNFLIELNALIFTTPTLVEVRAVYDNCCYILEMA